MANKSLPFDLPASPDLSASRANMYFMLRPGLITRVDPEKWEVDVQWLDGGGGRSKLPITSSFDTPRAFSGGMPEQNSLVLCHFVRYSQRSADPRIVAYLPSGYKLGLNYDAADAELGEFEVRRKRRKLYPGEILHSSTQGSDVLLDENVYLTDSVLDELWIRSADHSINMSSLNNYTITNAGRISNGLTVRNDVTSITGLGAAYGSFLNVNDAQGTPPASQLIGTLVPIVLPNGKRIWHVTTNLSALTLDTGGYPWCEHRLELLEVNDGVLSMLEQNGDLDVDNLYHSKRPDKQPGTPLEDNLVIIHVMGTLVGNNPLTAPYGGTSGALYGKVLKRQIFVTNLDTSPTLLYLPTTSALEEDKLASIYHFQLPKSDKSGEAKTLAGTPVKNPTVFDINKEGKVLFNLSASSVLDTLGEGRSVEGGIDGGTKLTMGRNTLEKESLRVDTVGKVVSTVGSDEGLLGESINLTLKGGLNVTIQQAATDTNAIKIAVTTGNIELVNSGTGNIKIETNAGNVDVKTTSGNVTIETLAGTADVNATGNVNVVSSTGNVAVEATVGKVQLKGPGGVAFPLNGVVTKNHVCAYTGAPHPQGSTDVEATG